MVILSSLLMMTLICTAAETSSKAGFCPLRSYVTRCSPSCSSDYQCLGGAKCCPNVCGSRSCVGARPVAQGGEAGSKYDGPDTVYCGNVKCRSSEKCAFDRTSRREKCIPK
ncbi:waprin-Thr1-like isoform X2 [Bacillus rossius redtenbacheri]